VCEGELMLDCREAAYRIVAPEAGGGWWLRRVSLPLHVLLCRHCRRYAAQLRRIRRAARSSETPDSRETDRLVQTVLDQTGLGDRNPPR